MSPNATVAAADAATTAHSALPGLGQTALSLVVVLVLIFALAALLKRLQGLRSGLGGGLRIHAGLQVGPKERVLLIEAGGLHVLVGVAAGSVRALHVYVDPPVLATPDAAGAPTSPGPSFTEALRRALGKPGTP